MHRASKSASWLKAKRSTGTTTANYLCFLVFAPRFFPPSFPIHLCASQHHAQFTRYVWSVCVLVCAFSQKSSPLNSISIVISCVLFALLRIMLIECSHLSLFCIYFSFFLLYYLHLAFRVFFFQLVFIPLCSSFLAVGVLGRGGGGLLPNEMVDWLEVEVLILQST